MNVRSILKTVAALQLVIVGCMAGCALLALALGEPEQVAAFLVPAAFVGMLSATVLAGLRHVAREVLLTREGFLFVTLSWISVSLSGSLPFVLSGRDPGLCRRLLRGDVRLHHHRRDDPDRHRGAAALHPCSGAR